MSRTSGAGGDRLGSRDTVFCTGTTRGVPFSVKARAASAAGFSAISIRPGEYDELLAEGRTPAQARAFLDDLGLAVAELDPVWLPVAEPPHPAHSVDDVLAMAEALRPDCISVLVPFTPPGTTEPEPLDLARATDAFGALCDHPGAADQRLALEFFAWSPLHTLADAATIVRGAGRANGGIILDTWHHARRGGTVRDIAGTDATRIWGVQIADAPHERRHPELAVECIRHRRWPGEGDVDLTGIVSALRAGGCRAPLGIEVFGPVHDEAEAHRRARHAYETLRPFAELQSRA